MARVVSPIKITGTIDDLTFYMVGNECFMRQKTSLNKKRFYSDPAYSGIPMMRVKNFGQASKVASGVYRRLPKAIKSKKLFNEMTALAHEWLWKAMPAEEVAARLTARFTPQEQPAPPMEEPVKPATTLPAVANDDAYPPLELPLPASIPQKNPLYKSEDALMNLLYRPEITGKRPGLVQGALQHLHPGWLRASPRRE